ncbi:programmed cell death 6-interacting protein isoform X3 [Scyliorhinus canicula]|uniref:programmed cell death 6-interacting protein isoform X3 n=1 Tax=Scyliorhinus canicula TaxID=7830 RepID=UPI0018F51277|nr:programmed cell death 6-interacting protein isoform X3 [Scyliorhinus canicula]
MMATTFVSVPVKKSSEVDMAKPLSKFIQATYPSGDTQAEYIRAAEELNSLRKNALGRPLDKHDSSLEILLRYYDQLCSIEPKFPFSENQLCLTFTWKDAFDKGSLFGGSVKLALASLGYEKSCVLFNVGALASQIAAEQNLENDEGLKAAAKYYQLASGVFQHIKDTVLSALNREPTMDISPDTVGTLSLIMLAQAQEVFFLKAAADKMKDAIIAKLANQAADYYGDAFKQCQYKENLPKTNHPPLQYDPLDPWVQYFYFQEVLPVLAAKHCMMQANAEYHQSILAKQQKKFGEEIGRLQHASDSVKTVASRYDEYINVKDLSDKITRALTAAKKDNDFIYHDRVPDVKDLEPVGKATLVKSTPVSHPMSQKYTDLFAKMVPLAVQQSLSIYNQRRADLVNRLIGQMRESTNLANGVLASLNLPAAIEDVSGDSIPQSILEKSKVVAQQGGLQTVDQFMRDLPELLQRNREILDEALNILDQEEVSDNELKAKFKERWKRTLSSELYKPLRAEGANFRTTLDRAVQADKVVRERYATHREVIALLCKPEAELNAAIPSGNPTKSLQGSEVVMLLKTLLASLNEVKKERETFENDIKSVQFDMSSRFLAALAQDGAISEEAISVTELDRLYGDHTESVQQNLKKQEELLAKIQAAHEEFSKSTQSNTDANQREEMLKKLAAGHDQFVELVANLKEGTKFYNGFTEILLKFQTKCSDIVFARKTERDELLKDLQQSIAREPSAPNIPAAPAYQTAAFVGGTTPAVPTPAPRSVFQPKPQPPARPPPPSVGATLPAAALPAAPATGVPAPSASMPASVGGVGMLSQAQGPPYPSYQGYPGFYAMPMPMAYNQYAYGQYNMPYMYHPPGQPPFQTAQPPQQPQQPQQPGYPYPQQQFYQQ